MIKIFTDGACSGNPGIGGWGVVIIKNNSRVKELYGGEKDTTNNQMELKATIEALKFFNKKNEITIYTDSKYVKNGIQLWIHKWKINGWKTANKKTVKNKNLWIELDTQIKRHIIKWKWIKGHEGNLYNEKADELAKKYIKLNLS